MGPDARSAMADGRARPRRDTTGDGTGDRPSPADETGSMVSEYGLVAVLGATIAGIAIAWAKGGAVTTLLAAVLRQLRAVVAA